MPGWLLRWCLNIIGILLTASLIDNFNVTLLGAVFGSVILGIVNVIIRPFILILTLPINLLSLGLFTLVINGSMLWLTSVLVKGFDIAGFGTAIISALIIAILNFFINLFINDWKI